MSTSTRHPEDGVLLRLLDGELVAAEARDHLAGCPACRRRMDTLSRRSERLDDALRSGEALIDEPDWPPDFLSTLADHSEVVRAGSTAEGSRPVADEAEGEGARSAGDGAAAGRSTAPRRRRLRSSAFRWGAAAALVTALVAVSPVRAWMVRSAEAVWAWITDGTGEQSPTAPAHAGPGSTEVVTAVGGRVLTIRLSGTVTPDSLVVRATREARARAVLHGGAGEGELLVRPDGFEVRASAGGGTVEVWAPPSVAEIRVTREGNELVRRSRGEEPGWSWRLGIPGTDSGPGA